MNKKKKRRSSKKVNDQMIEGIVALYKVTSSGGLQRDVQDTVKMGRKFFPSKDGNMVLTRSKDKKIISLTNFDRYDEDGNYFKIRAWTTKLGKVAPEDNYRTLEHCMNMYFEKNRSTFDELIEVSFVGGNLADEGIAGVVFRKAFRITSGKAVRKDLPMEMRKASRTTLRKVAP